MLLLMTMWTSSLRWSQHVESRRYGPAVKVLVTCFFFTFVTVLLQVLLAIALSEKPAPAVLPTAVNQWNMAITVWLFGALYYVIYADMNSRYATQPSYRDLIIAGVASVVSFAMTVYNMRQVASLGRHWITAASPGNGSLSGVVVALAAARPAKIDAAV
ncbi:uncharacterized protein [Triticum aestivum]|uniref:uncharacterized protein n=1 Tax=Triticum aestivum TaxID=4565 RepID=UPI001D00BD1F|nr:uncharacterized protein LOC123041058 [Triticum aestivum]